MSKTRIKLLFFLNYAEKNMGGIFLYVFYHCFSGGDYFTIIDHPFGGLTLSHVLLVGRICWAVTCVTMVHLLFVDTSELTNCWWVILTSTKSMLAHTDAVLRLRDFWPAFMLFFKFYTNYCICGS